MYVVLYLLIFASMFAAPFIGAIKYEVTGFIIGLAYLIIMIMVMGNAPALHPTAGMNGYIYP